MSDFYGQYLGVIKLFSGTFVPQGWANCDGSLMRIAENQALFAILGTTYGGDGRTTFALPELCGRAVVGAGQRPGLKRYEVGEASGAVRIRLSLDQIPSHTHEVLASSKPADQGRPGQAVWAKEPQGITFLYSDAEADTQMGPAAISQAGGGETHDNMQPFLTLRYIICIRGGEIPQRR